MADGDYGSGGYGDGLYGFGAAVIVDISPYLLPPYNWSVANNGTSWVAERRQMGSMVRQSGTTIDELAAKLAAYEAYVAARSTPVSPEWGQVYGPTANDRRRLVTG